ncbi:MAG: sugar ABC transporter permease [Clostridiales bacterium]|jgi:raffinose/stachyose/melibiose transport system permease protein|nr:sugar ABC transporter permease [Clostridiales bacterium]
MLDSIKPKGRVIFLYLLAPVLIYMFTVFVPLVAALYFSFFEWKGGPHMKFNGVANYVELLKDGTFWQAFGHNAYLIVACIIGQIGIAFVFVLIINSRLVKLKNIHRVFVFFPSTIAAVSIGFIWTMIYDQRRGILNHIIANVTHKSIKDLPIWLNNPKTVMLLVAIPLIWQYIGYYMVILFSAISSVDPEIFEVAELDGATAIQRAIHITFPLIRDTLLVCVTLCIAGNMKAFDSIYTLTSGGPGNASNVMALYGYNVSFKQSNMGYGSAISIGIFVLSLGVILISQLLTAKKSEKKERIEDEI